MRIYHEQLKFKILFYLNELPKPEYSDTLNRIWEKGINPVSFYRWLKIPSGSKKSIPADALKVISETLNVPMESLFNSPAQN